MTYSISAEIYDLLYDWKGYAREAELIHQLVNSRTTGASTLLDVACGTGRHLEHLRQWYDVEGLDAEEDLLVAARRRLPGVAFHLGDMRTFDLGRRFDVVTCLFSAIGYMHNPTDLAAALATMARHLAPGGVLLVEPWLAPDVFDPQHLSGATLGEGPDMSVARMNGSRVQGRLSVMDFHYLIGRPGSVEYAVEEHALALYTNDEYRAALEAAGLHAEHDEEGLMGRGLWIGRAGQLAG